ncbi:YdaU family protein [Rhizorhabdus histidinilytica]|uniref:YdaU family protein n=1 Tax=Rhizorhabdus histidinilytica TaxID=439228 RepID=UPI00321FEDC7
MSAQHYHKRYHSDALAGFMSLTLEERGAYQTLLDMMYDRAGSIPGNDRLIAGYLGCSLRKWSSLRETLVAKGKIRVLEDGSITNDRVEKELENAMKTSRKLAENGLKGAHKKHENGKKGNDFKEGELALPEPGHGHTRYQIPDNVPNGTAPADVAKQIFDTGVALLTDAGQPPGQARSMLGKWRKEHGDGAVLQALMEAERRAITNPVEWITGRFKNLQSTSGMDPLLKQAGRYRKDSA